jgi:hypothetical protein
MVSLTIEDGALHVEMHGADKLWTLRSRIDIPLANVRSIRRDTEGVTRWWSGLRVPGVRLPGLIKAGTYYQDGGLVFFDVHDPTRTVTIELRDERYRELVLEVADPDRVVAEVRSALDQRASTPMPAVAAVG